MSFSAHCGTDNTRIDDRKHGQSDDQRRGSTVRRLPDDRLAGDQRERTGQPRYAPSGRAGDLRPRLCSEPTRARAESAANRDACVDRARRGEPVLHLDRSWGGGRSAPRRLPGTSLRHPRRPRNRAGGHRGDDRSPGRGDRDRARQRSVERRPAATRQVRCPARADRSHRSRSRIRCRPRRQRWAVRNNSSST